MKASEFAASAIDFARPRGVSLCREEVDAFAGKLVEAGVLEADDNPQPRRVEVEGVVVQADEDGDLDVFIDEELTFTLIDDEVPRAAPLARALLAWVAAGEPQEQPQPAPEPTQGTRERPFIWKRRTESGGTEEVPVWLEQNGSSSDGSFNLCAGSGACHNLIHFFAGSERPGRAWSAVDYPGPKDDEGRALFNGDDLPQPAAQPQPEDGEVVLRLTREEAEAVCFALGKLKPGSTLEVYAKLDGLLDRKRSEREDKFRWEGSGAVIRR